MDWPSDTCLNVNFPNCAPEAIRPLPPHTGNPKIDSDLSPHDISDLVERCQPATRQQGHPCLFTR